ncbi:hypothetical protein MHU86_8237 [Fragilaria crotonensis]|nr:hypothetical protein MHU86_8237 [Fragilaria crotonensis]
MVNPALTHLPPTEANCPPTHCVKPTKHMANYVAADGDITAPFDALKNAVLPFKKHSFSYVATTNTSSIAESNTYRPKKSPKQAPGHFQHTATALTPEQESAVISRFLETIDQERLQDTNTNNRVNYACELSYEAGSTDMGRSHSLSIENGAINDIAAAKFQDNKTITRNTFASTIIPRQEDPNLPPTKGLSRTNVSDSILTSKPSRSRTTMKSRNATLSRFRRRTPKTSTTTRGYHPNRLEKGSPMHVLNQNSDEYSRRNRPNSGLHQRISAERTFYYAVQARSSQERF